MKEKLSDLIKCVRSITGPLLANHRELEKQWVSWEIGLYNWVLGSGLCYEDRNLSVRGFTWMAESDEGKVTDSCILTVF